MECHNGLICAAYMAKAGLHGAVIERNLEIGGCGAKGGPGYIAANAIAEELGVRPFWKKVPPPAWMG